MAPVIDVGVTLSTCQNLVGFDNLLKRVKLGERAALSEATIAAAMVGVGDNLVLAPPLMGKRLDVVVSIGDERVYIEMVAPDLSDAMKDAFKKR